MAITMIVNGKEQALDVEPDMPLLWALRETLGLTGTKFGCGISGSTSSACSLPLTIMVIAIQALIEKPR